MDEEEESPVSKSSPSKLVKRYEEEGKVVQSEVEVRKHV